MYSPELSLFVLEAGVKLLDAAAAATSCYLSLTDYVQHKYAPGEPEADRYYTDMDDAVRRASMRSARSWRSPRTTA